MRWLALLLALGACGERPLSLTPPNAELAIRMVWTVYGISAPAPAVDWAAETAGVDVEAGVVGVPWLGEPISETALPEALERWRQYLLTGDPRAPLDLRYATKARAVLRRWHL